MCYSGIGDKMSDNFKFKKRYGQNFLKNESIIEKIASSAGIQSNSLVIEVGPGQGVLTKHLAKFAKYVLCYEIDLELQSFLDENLKKYSNVEVKYGDFLAADLEDDLAEYDFESIYFVSNVPYYITTPILMKLMQTRFVFSSIVMMVQKEVGDRFSALPGTRDYGSISVYLNYFYDIKKLFYVSRNHFVPVPNVDSVVVSFVPKRERAEVYDLDFFFRLVRDSFQFKRKTLRNNLKSYDLDIVLEVLRKYDLDLSVRAEALSVSIFVDLSNTLCKNK